MWIIRFEHNKGSFQSKQSLLYELNLRSLPLDQAQDATKVEIHHTKTFNYHESCMPIVINRYLRINPHQVL